MSSDIFVMTSGLFLLTHRRLSTILLTSNLFLRTSTATNMKHLKKSASFIFCLLLTLMLTASWAKEEKTDSKLVILFTHDLHSCFLPVRVPAADGRQSKQGGYAKLAYLVKEQRALHGNKSLLVDAGDISMGTLFHTSFLEEASELRLMGDMGYDIVTFGNHDFDFHEDGLAEMLQTARSKSTRLPVLVASNVVFSEGKTGDASLKEAFNRYPVKEYTVLERNGIRIGLFGIMGKDAAEDTPFAAPLTFADPIQSSKRIVNVLKNREKVDVVVCLSHSGTSVDKKHSEDEILARDVPGIDVIISGHTHTVLPRPIVIGKTIIVSSGCYASYLGILGLDYSKQNGVSLSSYDLKSISDNVPDDGPIAAEISKIKNNVNQGYLLPYSYYFDQVIAESAFDMEDLPSILADPKETGLGNMITDAFRDAVEKAEGKTYDYIHLVVQPIGLIRDSFLKGDISVSEIFRVLSLGLGDDGVPGYPLVAVYINGDEMKALLEVETTVGRLKNDAHLQVSGVKFTYNPHRIPFDRVTSVQIREATGQYQPLESKRLYRVCMNYYTAHMVEFIRRSSYGILDITPKDREGRPVTDIKKMIVHADPHTSGVKELKEWAALAAYMKTFPDTDGNGIPNIPDRYKGPEGRIASEPSWNPLKIVAGGNYMTYGALGIVILILIILGVLIRKIARRFFHH
jgi:5'-nucleotidase/UDP-sugar diphosphatase